MPKGYFTKIIEKKIGGREDEWLNEYVGKTEHKPISISETKEHYTLLQFSKPKMEYGTDF